MQVSDPGPQGGSASPGALRLRGVEPGRWRALGRRVRDDLAAIYRPVPLAEVGAYLTMLERIDILGS